MSVSTAGMVVTTRPLLKQGPSKKFKYQQLAASNAANLIIDHP